jgi:transposase
MPAKGASVMGKRQTKQFKEQAMDLVRVQGYDPAAAARELGLPPSTLRVWLDKASWVKRPAGEAPLSEDPAALKAQVRELETRVKRLEMEKEILKKATAYFARESL